MTRRIRRILLVCSNYDSYSLEEDGRIESRITHEYSELNLSNPPVFVRVETTLEALSLARSGERFDLVITMYNVGEMDVFDFSVKMKALSPETPIVLLSSFSRELYRKIAEHDRSAIDYVFCWNNSTDLILAIIKLLEDQMNAEDDILEGGVQAILLVEDSIRYYSTYLPLLYKLVLQQNIESIRDALNEQQQFLRKRSRPKILLATNYDDALALYEKYHTNLLGVISDVGFVLHRGDAPEKEKLDAGVDFCHLIRKNDPTMPILMQSSQESMREVAEGLGVGFIVKKSKTLTTELGEYIEREFGFGDFVVTNPETGEETGRAHDLRELEKLMYTITSEEYLSLIRRNYFSRWLFARGLFSIARELRPLTETNTADIRKTTIKAIRDYRFNQALGVVARFSPETYNDAIRFAKLGDGSIGGKARGLSFLNHILQKYNLYDRWEDVRIAVPRTLVIATDYFERFIKDNGLKYVINADFSDVDILSEFVASRLPADLVSSLRVFLKEVRGPLAIRSSSKLEDSYYQPFAGVYSTYMIPDANDIDQRLRMIEKAIKSVYASVYYSSSRAYITATGNVISEESMAIILQEVCGSRQGDCFFPTMSGVARSVNFYPLGYEKPEEGIVKLAYGLGKAVVDGEQVLRFSPEYPNKVLQTSTPDLVMRETQRSIYALDCNSEKFRTSVDDAVNLLRIDTPDCTAFPSFSRVASTWDASSMRIVDSAYPEGPKYITFAQVLKYNVFPLADIVKELLRITAGEMKCGVELEFAADLDRKDGTSVFNVLQVRPISTDSRNADVDWDSIDTSRAIIRSDCALGTGWIPGVEDIIYLKRDVFDPLKTREMAEELTLLNARMRDQKRGYVLIGYGRWGSSIPSLGVPVRWSDISEAKAIVEASLENFRIDASQGTHFFQNLTSFNVGYVNVDTHGCPDDVFDYDALAALPVEEETRWFRLVHLSSPLSICVDGLRGKAFLGL